MRGGVRGLAWAGLVLALGAGTARPGDAPTPPEPPCQRDYHLGVSVLARPSRTPEYVGYYVGGGCGKGGDPRLPTEGTWGWDYQGRCFARRVWLNWCHGRRYQGGAGSYQTDGPELKALLPCGRQECGER